jgi:hypothetical protein
VTAAGASAVVAADPDGAVRLPPPRRREHVIGSLRSAAGRVVRTTPLYLALPPGRLRRTGAVLYHEERSPVDVCRYLAGHELTGTGSYLGDLVAARAAFRAGRDDLAHELLGMLLDRYPDRADPHLLRSELASYEGDAGTAVDHAVTARLLAPSLPAAAAAEIRARHRAGDACADEVALTAVARFPAKPTVLWAAARGCSSTAQFEGIRDRWRAVADRPDRVLLGVRPVGHAAARAGDLPAASALYAEGLSLLHAGTGSTTPIEEAQLRGSGAAEVVRDLVGLLDRAGVPFFLAAGTALGYVREGGPLGHDADIDVGVLDAHWDRGALLDLFDAHPRFRPDPVHPTSQKLALKHRGGAPVDVFRFYLDGERIHHDGTFVRWWNTPFGVHRIPARAGGTVPVPTPADRYLTESYGDWRVPDPGFDAFLDGPNVEVTWPAYRDLYLLRRAYARASTGDLGASREDVARIAATLAVTTEGRALVEQLERR